MTKKKEELIFYFREIPDLSKKWRMFLVLGILLVILGVLAFAFATWATLFTVEFLGILLLLGGGFQIASCVQARKWTGVSLSILLGILYIVVGAICLFKPLVGAEGLTLLLATFFFVSGLFRMITSFTHRFDHRGLMFFSGLISFILGILIVAEWPIAALWVIGLFVGIDLFFIGWGWIFLSLAAKKTLGKGD
ncbi:MAG: HdeD family acid-resistance protein [Chlamydiales bacterium]